jgi:hypothetical protein
MRWGLETGGDGLRRQAVGLADIAAFLLEVEPVDSFEVQHDLIVQQLLNSMV